MMFYFVDERWGMPSFKDKFWIQLGGFFLIVTGVLLYSDILIMPFIRTRRNQRKTNKNSVKEDQQDQTSYAKNGLDYHTFQTLDMKDPVRSR